MSLLRISRYTVYVFYFSYWSSFAVNCHLPSSFIFTAIFLTEMVPCCILINVTSVTHHNDQAAKIFVACDANQAEDGDVTVDALKLTDLNCAFRRLSDAGVDFVVGDVLMFKIAVKVIIFANFCGCVVQNSDLFLRKGPRQ